MYKVLLVDDDELVLEGLQKLVSWNELNLEVAGIAYDGFSALEILKEVKPHILIADIAMPIMTGLELARKAREILPELFIVFLTGHADFNYAKQAIDINAGGYIVKPVDYADFAQVLRDYAKVLDKRQLAIDRERKLNDSIASLKDDILIKWLENELDLEAVPPVVDEYGGQYAHTPVFAAIIEIDDALWRLGQYSETERAVIINQAFSLLRTHFHNKGLSILCLEKELHMVVVAECSPGEPTAFLNEVVALARKQTPLTVTIGVGMEVPGFRKAPVSYSQAREALALKMFYGKDRVIFHNPARDEKEKDEKKRLDSQLEAIFIAIGGYDVEQARKLIKDLFELLRSVGDRFAVYNIAVHIVMKLDEFLHTLGEDLFDLMSWDFGNIGVLYQFDTLADIEGWIGGIVDQVMGLLHAKRLTRKSVIIENVHQYAAGRLEENLTLKEVAEHFSMSPNYLGFLFKEETGENFTDYISRMRMEKVRELLDDPRLKIYEIADRMGYSNMTYFHGKFKEYFGVSPGDYRKRRV